MQSYYRKKCVCAALLLGLVLLLALATLLFGRDKIAEELRLLSPVPLGDVHQIAEGAESAVLEGLFGEDFFTEVNGFSATLLHKREINNFSIVKDKNGALYSSAFYIAPDANLFHYAKRLSRMKDAVTEKGGQLLYLNAPEKELCLESTPFDPPVREYDTVQDRFLFSLSNVRVDFLDLRKSLTEAGVEPSRLFYKTDKAVTTYGSFVEFCALVQAIEEKCGIALDPDGLYTSESAYEIECRESCFLGNIGYRCGSVFSGLDDFWIYRRKAPQHFLYEYTDQYGKSFSAFGDDGVLLFEEGFDFPGEYSATLLDYYLNDNNIYQKITNLDRPDGLKILMISDDSFGPVAYFLAPLCKELHTIMPHTSAVDIESYLGKNDFDLVLVCNSASRIRSESFDYYEYKG